MGNKNIKRNIFLIQIKKKETIEIILTNIFYKKNFMANVVNNLIKNMCIKFLVASKIIL